MQNTSIGMAKPPKGHQRLIWDICSFINNEVFSIEYLALPEANISDADHQSAIPDVLVVNTEAEENILFIELERKDGVRAAIKKMQQRMQETGFTECFIVQYLPVGFVGYKIQKWYKVTPLEAIENDTFSELLDIDFDDMDVDTES
jgi:hypothetical protein